MNNARAAGGAVLAGAGPAKGLSQQIKSQSSSFQYLCLILHSEMINISCYALTGKQSQAKAEETPAQTERLFHANSCPGKHSS